MIIKITQYLKINKKDLKESMNEYDFDTWQDLMEDVCCGIIIGQLDDNYNISASKIGEVDFEEVNKSKQKKLEVK